MMVSYDAVHLKVIRSKKICVSMVYKGEKPELLKSVVVKNKKTTKNYDGRAFKIPLSSKLCGGLECNDK
jgi:hypothetical protein